MVKLLQSDIKLLKKLQTISAVTGNEGNMKTFLLQYIQKNKSKWKKVPKVVYGNEFGEMIIMVFGKPRTAVLAHMDEVGFMTGHNKKLFRLGNTKEVNNDKLYGYANNKKITATLIKKPRKLYYRSNNDIPLGTFLSYVPNWKESKNYVINGGMDNCVGMLCLLRLAKTLENGILVFTQREEGGVGGLGSIAKYIYDKCKVSQILICDVTSTSKSIRHGEGSVIGVGIEELPDQAFFKKIMDVSETYNLSVQAEIRKTGKSDFTRLLTTPYYFDMCYIGTPISNKHSSKEKIHKSDILDLFKVYNTLMKNL